MRDLKEEIDSSNENNTILENPMLHNRSYYNKHLTSNILNTKVSFVPSDSLF